MPVLPELHRLKAAIALVEGDEQGAEASLREAMMLAKKNSSTSFELRAATDFALFRLKKNRDNKACELIQEVVNTIEEGDCEPYCSAAHLILQSDHCGDTQHS